MHRTTRSTFAVLSLVLALVAGACGGGDDDSSERTTTTPAPTTTVAPPPAAPLTGLPVSDPGAAARPALVVKIDNVEPKARPQAGINQADVVYEERVEGSVTRLFTVFHSTDVGPVGPVRSARTSDIPLVSQLNRPFFAWSGANIPFTQRIRAANLEDVGVDRATGEYERDRGRPAPSNLMLRSTAAIRSRESSGGPPAPIFTYRAAGQQPAHLEAVAAVQVSYGSLAGSAPVDYRWNGEGWARSQKGTPHVDSAGVQVAPPNVIIQFVNYVGSDIVDQFGKPIPEAQTVGEGEVWVLTAGGLVRGTWRKPSLEAVTTYTDVDGNPIGLTPGRTWVALPMPGGATVTG
ncbi:MAG TPA: DUF3048 domain-containing protein [Acidimicrobiales bacterium]|nr:DUF3048 domain-containing protein [Acidimicrobiales bacterium]